MSLDREQMVSAQVILRPQSGKSIGPETAITSQNIHEYLPSTEMVTKAMETFQAAGFQVGPVVGNSFSITAPVSTFEQVFNTRLNKKEHSGFGSADGGSFSNELSLRRLPGSLANLIESITFTPPPDFGPTNY